LKAVGITTAPGVVYEKKGANQSGAFIDAMMQHRHWNRPK
jgi:hypothetical protein